MDIKIVNVIGGKWNTFYRAFQTENGEVFLEDDHGFLMEKSELERVAVGIMQFLSNHSENLVHNYELSAQYSREIESQNDTPRERATVEGYCLLIRNPEQNMWQWTRVGPGQAPRTDSLEDKLKKKIESIPNDYAVPAEVIKLYYLSDMHRFYHRVRDIIQHAYNERRWYDLNETDLNMFQTDNFGPRLSELIISKRELVEF